MKLHGKCCVYVTRNSCGSIVDSFTYTEKLTDAAEIFLPNSNISINYRIFDHSLVFEDSQMRICTGGLQNIFPLEFD